MALKPCSACTQRFAGKATSVYSAWMDGQGRESYRASLCMDCVYAHIAPLIKRSIARGMDESCDQCGGADTKGYDIVWLNVYLPKREQEAFELMFCQDDAKLGRSRLAHMSTRLTDRQPVSSRGLANERDEVTSVPW
jgi:hypothetical protein